MYECFHCGEKTVIWDGDFSFEDYGEEGGGMIHECHCINCGAQITYKIPMPVEKYTCEIEYCIYKDSHEYKCEDCVHYVLTVNETEEEENADTEN